MPPTDQAWIEDFNQRTRKRLFKAWAPVYHDESKQTTESFREGFRMALSSAYYHLTEDPNDLFSYEDEETEAVHGH